jgi:hypothetical protein
MLFHKNRLSNEPSFDLPGRKNQVKAPGQCSCGRKQETGNRKLFPVGTGIFYLNKGCIKNWKSTTK